MGLLKRVLLIVSFAPLLLLPGCRKTLTVSHPGAINSFDNNAYDTLMVAQKAIDQAKIDIAKFPQFQAQLDQARVSYNTAMNAYKLYHTALASGGTPETAVLTQQIGAVVKAVAELLSQFRPKPKPTTWLRPTLILAEAVC